MRRQVIVKVVKSSRPIFSTLVRLVRLVLQYRGHSVRVSPQHT